MKPVRHLILMTGTPLTTPMDVFGYTRFTYPQAYYSQAWFEAAHVVERDMHDNVTKWKDKELLQENFLHNAARVFRREIDEDLPQVTYEPITYSLTPEHKAAYNQLAELAMTEVEGKKLSATTVQKLNTMLQQIIIGYEGFFETDSQKKKARKKVAGFDLLDEVMDSLGTRKLIVFAYFQKSITALKDHGSKYNAVAIYGGMTDKQRQEALSQFLEDEACRLLIGQPLSMGSGLDSLKDVCSDILFLELPMIAKDFEQAVGRIDRNGQKERCHVRIATAKGTLQVRRQKALLDKDEQANEIQLNMKDLRDWIYGDE
ncbi:hypothetical protein CRG49_002065 [Neisseria sp. N95_16]|uniref:Helicase C-terminal domain-containing protein n=1 Tax=Neisseria brasiliensis TaxID=2666100 RepID=A0A7X2GYZ0_9NEIS|nr:MULTISPECIES: helicase-related protein [Neisseria]MRN38573.1 hypothetical protein [Neisseria brasiliensis]PJO10490.1 hypothetical protein CRG49_002065 [Neisseria sp. N95_16]